MNDNNTDNKFINNQMENSNPHNIFINVEEASDSNQEIQNDISDSVTISYDTINSANTNPDIIFCAKCGGEMKKNARYCMKCGNLNYDHPDNVRMKKIAMKNVKAGEFISGVSLDNDMKKTSSGISSDLICLLVNVFFFVLPAIVFIILPIILPSLVSNPERKALSIIFSLLYAILFLYSYSIQRIFIKAGEPWWGYYVPFYGPYLMYKIALANGWLFLTALIPLVGPIISLMVMYNLGTKFYKNGWLTLFFPGVMIPIIAFDRSAEYSVLAKQTSTVNRSIVDSKGRTLSEVNYRRKKFIITLVSLVIVSIVLYLCWDYLMIVLRLLYSFFIEQLKFYEKYF